MTKKIDVGILGGDKRHIELINSLHHEGHNIFATGFDKAIIEYTKRDRRTGKTINFTTFKWSI